MFVVTTEACICAPEDSWTHRDGEFTDFKSAVAYAKAGQWHGDVLRIHYGSCVVAYCDDYGFEMGSCSAIERARFADYVPDDNEYDELPF